MRVNTIGKLHALKHRMSGLVALDALANSQPHLHNVSLSAANNWALLGPVPLGRLSQPALGVGAPRGQAPRDEALCSGTKA